MNKLKLNIAKTKSMVLNSNLENGIKINNNEIEIVEEIKYLGLVIDNKLNFKAHINYICKKLAKKNFFFSKIRQRLSLASAIRIYNVLIKPHFEYCSTILYTCTNELLNRLQKLQNKCMRIILKVNRFASIKFMLDALKFLNISQRIKYNVLIVVFKIKNNIYPKFLCDKIIYVNDVHNYQLRNVLDIRLPFFRRENCKRMLMYNGLKLFNELPTFIKNENNFTTFKQKLLKFIKNT